MKVMLDYERKMKLQGWIAGVDEAGRGPLAGPVVASAVILPASDGLDGLNDSKKLSAKMRENLYKVIVNKAVSYGVAVVGSAMIDKINILQATLLAMRQAVKCLKQEPSLILVDGNLLLDVTVDQRALVGGDGLSRNIAAASIIAKVTRDQIMGDYHGQYPQYAFDRHKGYGTVLHHKLLQQYGPCPIHRKSFKGVREFIE